MAKNNMLVDGEWRTDVESRTTEDGEYDRVETVFRDWIRDDPDARFTPNRDRYHLYISRNCPWSHGTTLVHALLGLTDIISLDVVDPRRKNDGWEFTSEKDGCTADSINGSDYLRQVYTTADSSYTGRVTVPVLWDKKEETIVNNESIEIMRMLENSFSEYGNDVTLYPESYRDEIDQIVDSIYDSINNGVYLAGFAESQEAYDEAVEDLFEALDYWNDVLADRRYLAGDRLTLADARMFPTLIRFDEVYHTGFKCDKQYLYQYEHLWGYLRDLYQMPGVAETVRIDHIEEGYFKTEGQLDPDNIVSAGPDLDFNAPHDRGRLPGEPPVDLRE